MECGTTLTTQKVICTLYSKGRGFKVEENWPTKVRRAARVVQSDTSQTMRLAQDCSPTPVGHCVIPYRMSSVRSKNRAGI